MNDMEPSVSIHVSAAVHGQADLGYASTTLVMSLASDYFSQLITDNGGTY